MDAVKAEKIFPFSVPIVLGTLLTERHVRKMDPAMRGMIVKESPSLTSHVIHLLVKCPPFVSDRDFVNITFIYIFKDGSVLVGMYLFL